MVLLVGAVWMAEIAEGLTGCSDDDGGVGGVGSTGPLGVSGGGGGGGGSSERWSERSGVDCGAGFGWGVCEGREGRSSWEGRPVSLG
jgi:hypothetical protein